jgi:hypothetical protein
MAAFSVGNLALKSQKGIGPPEKNINETYIRKGDLASKNEKRGQLY